MTTPTRFVYFARPIDQAGSDPRASAWASRALGRLSVAGVGAFRPDRAFHVPEGARPGPYIERVNRAALAESSGLLALLPAGVPSVGVPMEIKAAVALGLPVAVVTDGPTWSLVDRLGISVFPPSSVEAAVEWLAVEISMDEVYERRAPLRFAPTGRGAKLPTRAHADDAGLDLYVSHRTVIPSGQFADVPCSVGVEMEPCCWGLIIGRSSTLRKRNLMVNPGIIDPGYRGELYAGCFNLGKNSVYLEPGERVAQFILMPNQTALVEPRMVDELATSARGLNGFGSSGL